MADSEIEPATEQQQQQRQQEQQKQKPGKKKKSKRERPDDAVKIGCGGLFRRKKKSAKGGKAENGDDGEDEAASKAPIEKPKKPDAAAGKSSVKGTVKIEDSPQAQMWSNIVSNSLVGTGIFTRAAVCSLETGGVLARNPENFTPSVEQVAALRDNFASGRRGVFSGAGFGVADTVYRLQEETATPEILCGANADQTEGVLVALSSTAALIGVYRERLDRAMETLGQLRSHSIDQGL